MNKILESLIKLQNIDIRLIEIEELKGGLPDTVQDQKSELLIFDKQNVTSSERLKDIDLESRKTDGNIEDFANKLAK